MLTTYMYIHVHVCTIDTHNYMNVIAMSEQTHWNGLRLSDVAYVNLAIKIIISGHVTFNQSDALKSVL